MADYSAEPLAAVLRRLKDERDEADARYNDALTALDRAIRPPGTLPPPSPSGLDDSQIAALNDEWNILPAPPHASGLRAKLTGYIWGVIGPYLQRQLTFNSHLVDHLNRQAAAQRDAHRATEAAADALRDHLSALPEFQSRLMQYLQQITAYVDTKDRDGAGGALILNASLSGLAENLAKHAESMAAREHRYDARATALSAAQEELRAMIGVAQHALVSLKREVERLRESSRAVAEPGTRNPEPRGTPSPRSSTRTSTWVSRINSAARAR
jgi:hypothetical protein